VSDRGLCKLTIAIGDIFVVDVALTQVQPPLFGSCLTDYLFNIEGGHIQFLTLVVDLIKRSPSPLICLDLALVNLYV
jgi:hypothetical protein